jgi:uncharacterized OsmC-like protein
VEKIKRALENIEGALTADPSRGRGTGKTTTRVRFGMACEIESGPWRLVADLPKAVGGTGLGPTPGVLGRAALGSCLAMTYVMRAAKLGVALDELEVEVQADYDDGVLFGTSQGMPGYSEVRYVVSVKTDASEADVLRVLDDADVKSPYLDVFARAQPCKRIVKIERATK